LTAQRKKAAEKFQIALTFFNNWINGRVSRECRTPGRIKAFGESEGLYKTSFKYYTITWAEELVVVTEVRGLLFSKNNDEISLFSQPSIDVFPGLFRSRDLQPGLKLKEPQQKVEYSGRNHSFESRSD